MKLPIPGVRRRALRRIVVVASLALAEAMTAVEGGAQRAPDGGSSGAPAAVAPGGTAQQRTQRSRRRPRRRAPARPALRFTTPASADALRGDLGTMLGARTRNGRWGVMVVSLTRGDTLYSLNAGESMIPASTMKLFTAALALERFGPDHRFTTEVLRTGTLEPDGTVTGDLVLRGGGDPGFSNRFIRGGASAPVDVLASLVVGQGIKRIRGSVIADATAFEARTIPEGWRSRYLGMGYAAPFSALSINENLVIVDVQPSGTVALEPATTMMAVSNRVRTVRGSRGGNLAIRRVEGGIEVRGWIGTASPPRRYLHVVDNPATFTAGALVSALARQGVVVEGGVRSGAAPADALPVASLPSEPLSRLVSVMNRESINHYAELIFRNAVRDSATAGSAERGNEMLRRFLVEKAGAAPTDVFATDGSGLSYLDQVTPRAMMRLLDYAHRAPWASAFHASLPVAGESELLRNRMRLTPAQGNLHAKTGTTNEVVALAGYATARNGEVLAFVFLYNGRDRSHARETIDAMGPTLAGFIRE